MRNPLPFILFLLLFIAPFQVGASAESSVTFAGTESEKAEKSVLLRPSIVLSVGSSSNVGKLRKETAGSYGKVSPSLGLEYTPSETFLLNTQINADFKHYSAADARALADEDNAEIRSLGIWFLDESWELGGDAGATHSQSKIPVQLSSAETKAEPQKYTEPDGKIYLAWNHEDFSLEAGANARIRTYSTPLKDRGNIFYNDFELHGVELKVGYGALTGLKLTLRSLLEKKTFKEKPADFTDGAPSISTSPLPTLQESAKEFGLTADYSIGRTKLASGPAVRFNKDRVFGARDSRIWKFQQKITVPLSKQLAWAPSFIISQELFTHFRSDPQNDPLGSPLRRDMDLKAASPIQYSFNTSLQILAEYSFTRKSSNYADSSFSEHTISTGISVSL